MHAIFNRRRYVSLIQADNMVERRLGRRNYGPSRTRWLLIGFILGLIIGLTWANPGVGFTDLASPSSWAELIPLGDG